jgi:hypothetical protein
VPADDPLVLAPVEPVPLEPVPLEPELAPVAAAPPPLTVITSGALAAELLLLPAFPISTPTPIAIRSVAMPAISVAADGQERCDPRGGPTVSVTVAGAVMLVAENRPAPRRSPHWTQ